MREEGVLAVPALAVARVERVDVDVAAVVVGRRAGARGGEPVHGPAAVHEPPEQMVVATAVHPIRPGLERRRPAGPVGEMQLPGSEPGMRPPVEVRQRPAPRLHGPIRPARRRAPRDEEGELRAGVRAAGIAEPEPGAAGVVLAELHLRQVRIRVARVDRAPRAHVVHAALRAVREQSFAVRVHR